jgi:membrane-associated phospholipid phosphatase
LESEYSFPSGHTTSVAAAMWPVFLNCKKKVSWLVFLFVIAIGATRNYIMVHFPSDILGGMIVGFCAGFVSYLIVNAIWKKFEPKNSLLIRADLPDLFRKKKAA